MVQFILTPPIQRFNHLSQLVLDWICISDSSDFRLYYRRLCSTSRASCVVPAFDVCPLLTGSTLAYVVYNPYFHACLIEEKPHNINMGVLWVPGVSHI